MIDEAMVVTQNVMTAMAKTVGAFPPETGGVLGAGPDGIISFYYFDRTGICTETGYRPDVDAINEMLSKEWMPNEILMVGIVHSHADGNTTPSCGDIAYGIRILQALDTVDHFYLSIVTQGEYGASFDFYVIRPDPERRFVCKKIGCRLAEWPDEPTSARKKQ